MSRRSVQITPPQGKVKTEIATRAMQSCDNKARRLRNYGSEICRDPGKTPVRKIHTKYQM